MKKSPLAFTRTAQLLTLLAAAPLVQQSAHADNATWAGADGVWGTLSNWSGPPAAVPGAADTATFGSTGYAGTGPAPVNNGAATPVNNITFDATAQDYRLSGTINLTAGGSILASGGAQTIAATYTETPAASGIFIPTGAAVQTGGSATVTNNSAGLLSIGINSINAGSILTFDGTGPITTVASLASGGNTSSVVKNGSGTLTLGNFSNTNIQGGFTINAGTAIGLNGNSFSNRNLTVTGGATVQMNASGGASAFGNTAGTGVTVNGDAIFRYNVNTSQWRIGQTSGQGFLSSSNNPVLTFTTAGGTGNIQNYLNNTNFVGTWKLGDEGVLALNHINARNGGSVRLNMGDAASTGRHILQAGAIFASEGATQAVLPVNFGELSGTNTGALLSGRQNLGTRTTGTQYIVGGLNTNSAYAGGISDGVNTAGVLQMNGPADGSAGAGGTSAYARTNGAAGVQGTTELIKIGTGTLTLTGTSTHRGGTVVQGGALAVNSDAALGATYDGSLRVFSVIPGTGVYTTLPDTVLAGGGGTGAVANLYSSVFGTNANNNLFLSFSSQSSNGASGNIVNNVTGTGYTSVPTVSFTGGVLGTAGTVPTASVRVQGLLTLDGGALQTDAGITSNRAIVIGAGNGAIETMGFSSTFSGNINGSGNLALNGGGTVTLSGVNALTGVTTVGANTTLNLAGSLAGTVTVNATGHLAGSGSATGATINGEISPGNSIGTLTFSGSTTLAGVSTMELDPGASAADLINVTAGGITLGGDLNVSLLSAAAVGNYNIIDAPSFSGSFANVNLPALSGGLTWDTSLLNTQGILSIVPEPGSAALGLLGASLLLRRRRKA